MPSILSKTEGDKLKDLLDNSTINGSRFVEIYIRLAGMFGSAYETIMTIGWTLIVVFLVIAIIGYGLSREQRSFLEYRAWIYKLIIGVIVISIFESFITYAYFVGTTVGK